ncbi:hypothetical protein AV521_03435 [Streptomyces sp. IMTB 2501]|nr:hypothetical protein AV521_03435 [Streptomyces sp. IMTB 2501]
MGLRCPLGDGTWRLLLDDGTMLATADSEVPFAQRNSSGHPRAHRLPRLAELASVPDLAALPWQMQYGN